MRIRTVGLLGIGALAMVLVGCAHSTASAPRISFLPDSFAAPEVRPDTRPATRIARKAQRAEQGVTMTRGRHSVGATAMLTESGDGKLHAMRAAPQRAKTTRNGKKKDPSQLNVPMLIKMGGFAKLYGAADDTEADSGAGKVSRKPDSNKRAKKSDFITWQNRASRLTNKKARPPMLNMNMLIKGGFFAKMAEGALKERRKYNPSMLNMNMLIKMGGFARGLEKDNVRKPNMRHVARQLQSQAMHNRRQRARRATREFKMRMRTNSGLLHRRSQLGGRCYGRSCRD